METICQEGAKLEPMAKWKKPICVQAKASYCEPKKYEVLYDVPKYFTKDMFIMRNCCHNEFVGLRNRYLKDTPNNVTLNVNLLKECIKELALLLKPNFSGPISVNEFFANKKGKLRKRYLDAFSKIEKNGLNLNKHNATSAFVKNEIYDEMKPPRMIINRDTRFNIAYGRFTMALEKAMTKIPEFSKGKNFFERGQQFKDLLMSGWWLEGDCSKYESTQRERLLKLIELQLMNELLEDEKTYKEFETLFYAKLKKHGFTQNGVKFSFWALRGSGDMDTGLFNSIFMWLACRYFEKVNGTGCRKFIVDGDDNVVSIPKGTKDFVDTFAHFGFDAKLNIRKDYHDVDYCSGKFIQYNRSGDFVYVQNIKKIMNNMSVFRKEQFKHCKTTYYHSLGYMYKQIYGDMPLFANFANFLLRSTKGCHVETEILKELNPMYVEQLSFGPLSLAFDDTIKVELAMTFDLNITLVNKISEYFDEGILDFEPWEKKRFRKSGQQTQLPTEAQFNCVESYLRR